MEKDRERVCVCRKRSFQRWKIGTWGFKMSPFFFSFFNLSILEFVIKYMKIMNSCGLEKCLL